MSFVMTVHKSSNQCTAIPWTLLKLICKYTSSCLNAHQSTSFEFLSLVGPTIRLRNAPMRAGNQIIDTLQLAKHCVECLIK
jgi:hypothetical protein